MPHIILRALAGGGWAPCEHDSCGDPIITEYKDPSEALEAMNAAAIAMPGETFQRFSAIGEAVVAELTITRRPQPSFNTLRKDRQQKEKILA